jgi:hypothetical protein
MRTTRCAAYARGVFVVIAYPDLPDMRSVLWFWPGLAAPIHFLVTMTAGEAA